MLKLVKKDLLAARWILLANVAALFLYSLQSYFTGSFIILFGAAVVQAIMASIFFYEDRNKTEILYLSLPVKRETVVAARHLLAAIVLAGVGLVIFGMIGLLGEAVLSARPENDPFPLMSIEAAAVFTLCAAGFVSLYLAVYHRFGFGRGSIVYVIISVILITATMAIIVTRFPDDFDMAKNADGAKTIFGALQTVRVSLGTPLFLLAAALLTVVPFLVSLFLSRRFYARREF